MIVLFLLLVSCYVCYICICILLFKKKDAEIEVILVIYIPVYKAQVRQVGPMETYDNRLLTVAIANPSHKFIPSVEVEF